jgi:hypothetical protein
MQPFQPYHSKGVPVPAAAAAALLLYLFLLGVLQAKCFRPAACVHPFQGSGVEPDSSLVVQQHAAHHTQCSAGSAGPQCHNHEEMHGVSCGVCCQGIYDRCGRTVYTKWASGVGGRHAGFCQGFCNGRGGGHAGSQAARVWLLVFVAMGSMARSEGQHGRCSRAAWCVWHELGQRKGMGSQSASVWHWIMLSGAPGQVRQRGEA